eukprot:scaffold15586_cov100-Isochrysis_galbana.AAC.8
MQERTRSGVGSGLTGILSSRALFSRAPPLPTPSAPPVRPTSLCTPDHRFTRGSSRCSAWRAVSWSTARAGRRRIQGIPGPTAAASPWWASDASCHRPSSGAVAAPLDPIWFRSTAAWPPRASCAARPQASSRSWARRRGRPRAHSPGPSRRRSPAGAPWLLASAPPAWRLAQPSSRMRRRAGAAPRRRGRPGARAAPARRVWPPEDPRSRAGRAGRR